MNPTNPARKAVRNKVMTQKFTVRGVRSLVAQNFDQAKATREFMATLAAEGLVRKAA